MLGITRLKEILMMANALGIDHTTLNTGWVNKISVTAANMKANGSMGKCMAKALTLQF
jgi:hypothetical protein